MIFQKFTIRTCLDTNLGKVLRILYMIHSACYFLMCVYKNIQLLSLTFLLSNKTFAHEAYID
jgi:hypothetical protein